VDRETLHIGAVDPIHRFVFSLNEHTPFHGCLADGLIESVQRNFVGRGLLESCQAKEAPTYPYSGFSLDTLVPQPFWGVGPNSTLRVAVTDLAIALGQAAQVAIRSSSRPPLASACNYCVA